MMKRSKADAKPTWTFLVVDALRQADDFMSTLQLCDRTGGSVSQVTAALHHLKTNAKAVDCIESEGSLWWFLTGEDLRQFTQDERIPEEPGTRRRGRRSTDQ